MASNQKDKIEDLITCGICKELFDDPRMMPCSHTYCYKCIKHIASADGHFECSRHDNCKILQHDIDSLPVNQDMCGLVELYRSIQPSNKCNNCESVEAEYTCDKCDDVNFCLECYNTVHMSPVMQKHQQLSIDQKRLETSPCRIHPKKKLECWCHTCATVICIDCLLFEHKNHKYAPIDDVAKDFEAKINSHLPSIQSSLEAKLSQADILINEIDDDSNSLRKRLTDFMASLHQFIDEHEKNMLQQVSTIEQEGKKKIEDYKTPLKCELRNLNVQKATFEILLFSKNQIKLLQAKQGFNDYMNKINGTIKSLQIPRKTRYCLEGLHQLQTIKDKITECGRCAIMSSYRNSELEKIINDHGTRQNINLKSRHLIDSDMTIVANVLQSRTNLITLDLGQNQIGQQGAKYIAEAVRSNQTLTGLCLVENQIGPQGAEYIAEVLKNNRTLTTLDLKQNQIGQQGAKHIAEALKTNETLIILGLHQNQIEQQGAQHIAEGLKINQTLTILYLSENQIGQQGAQHIAEALKINQTLTVLDLQQNQIGQQGAQHIAESLKINRTLEKLYLRENQIGQQGAQYIAEAIKINQTLTTLELQRNQIGQQGTKHIVEALRINRILTTLYLEENEIRLEVIQHAQELLKSNNKLTIHW